MSIEGKPKALILCGAPASGKSTLAAAYVKDGYAEINRDNIRFKLVHPGGDWTTYQFTEQNEKQVTVIWNDVFNHLTEEKIPIVISDTNCKRKYRNRLEKRLTQLGYDVTVVILDFDPEVLISRDAKRGVYSVGADVITKKVKELRNEH